MKRLASLFLALAVPAGLQACPLCFRIGPFKVGLLWGSLLLLPVPFLVGGALAWWVWRGQDRPEEEVPEKKAL